MLYIFHALTPLIKKKKRKKATRSCPCCCDYSLGLSVVTDGCWGYMSNAPLRWALNSRNWGKNQLLCPESLALCCGLCCKPRVLGVTSVRCAGLYLSSPCLVRRHPLFGGREQPAVGMRMPDNKGWRRALSPSLFPGVPAPVAASVLTCVMNWCAVSLWPEVTVDRAHRGHPSCCQQSLKHSGCWIPLLLSSNPAEGFLGFCF